MKYIILATMALTSVNVIGATAKYCNEIERFRIWATGSDTNGIWVEYKENPAACPGGFYLPHVADNKDYAFSFLLSEKAQGNKVCMQVITDIMISSRCKINYVYNP
ncbi:MAG: hypothetical protein GY820_39995 [Gammaproteobacteria bacterium]|nr:hypothetical protein [Gammaproteobacteria bacterium]